jgi:galactose mutarotase-like enzyme
MFDVRSRENGFTHWDLIDTEANTQATIVPARGGMISHWQSGDRSLLFLDENTFHNPKQNVRGGVPILFPSPGKLEADQWAWQEKKGSLKQHGFARTNAWDVVSSNTGSEASLVLRLSESAESMKQFPWRFTLEIIYRLRGNSLRIDHYVTNNSSKPMPYGFGFHPYFHVKQSEKAQVEIETKATKVFDNVSKETRDFDGFDLSQSEVDLHLIDHGSHSSSLTLPDGAKIEMEACPEFQRWVVWTLQDRDFVCLEPWTCPANALNSEEQLLVLKPRSTQALWVEIRIALPTPPTSLFSQFLRNTQ